MCAGCHRVRLFISGWKLIHVYLAVLVYNAVADAYCLPPPQASELKIGMIRTSSSRDIRYDRAGSFYSFSAFSLGIYGHGRIGGE